MNEKKYIYQEIVYQKQDITDVEYFDYTWKKEIQKVISNESI